jgi:hypothetical protein
MATFDFFAKTTWLLALLSKAVALAAIAERSGKIRTTVPCRVVAWQK